MTEREKKQRESNQRAAKMTVLVLQIGFSMLTCMFLCGAAGVWLANRTGKTIVFPLFLVLGILVGYRACYKLITRVMSLKNPEGVGLAIHGLNWWEDDSENDMETVSGEEDDR